MGQRFVITESERNQIRSLYEQSTTPEPNSPESIKQELTNPSDLGEKIFKLWNSDDRSKSDLMTQMIDNYKSSGPLSILGNHKRHAKKLLNSIREARLNASVDPESIESLGKIYINDKDFVAQVENLLHK
jgi:hypothetical protein